MRDSVASLKIAPQILTITVLFSLIAFVSASAQTDRSVRQDPYPTGNQWQYSQEQWGIIIGINNYKDDVFRDLDYAANDAIKIYIYLTSRELGTFDKDHLHLLTDIPENKLPPGIQAERPTRNNILKKLKSLKEIPTPQDAVFFYFSGHGMQLGDESYLLPSDAVGEMIQETAIPLQKGVLGRLDESKARKQVIVMDTCRDDPTRDKSISGVQTEAFIEVLYRNVKGRAILTSADVGQRSYELPEYGHGIFTYYLLKALGGEADHFETGNGNQIVRIGNRDGQVTVSEASQYVSAYVKLWAYRSSKNQTPRMKYSTDGDIVLTVPGTGKPVELETGEPVEPPSKTIKGGTEGDEKSKDTQKRILAEDGTEMVLIPAGEFEIGSNEASEEQPLHRVYLDDFYIYKYEVTNAQYQQFVKDTGYRSPAFRKNAEFNHPDQPVVGVSWDDAVAYCQWLSRKSGKRYRLPTEAEWEKAARGGLSGMKFPWETSDLRGKANFGSVEESAARVGSFKPNGYGLHDMVGNVWEWCSDWYAKSYYSQSPNSNPKGPESGLVRVVRGGSWASATESLRCANRHSADPSERVEYIGFRCVRELK
jgi:formylglycine-generating enzyme